MATLNKQMAAVYTVSITGISRTKRELERLDNAIHSLRTAKYSSTSTTVAASLGLKDLFVTKLDDLEGRIQGGVVSAMDAAVKQGKDYQTFTLVKAETPTGRSGRGRNPGGRRGPGRDDTGTLIDSLDTNVETFKSGDATQVTGWHGWPLDDRVNYARFQEKSKKYGVNSLGHAIIPVREFLKKKLKELKK